MATIKEHDRVVLTVDLPEEKLTAGDVGVVVHIHAGGEAYEVEFVALDGETIAITTLEHAQVRPQLPIYQGKGGLGPHVNPLSNRSLFDATDDDT